MLEAVQLSKSFDSKQKALDNVSLKVQPGEFLTLLGPSGCGKTTFLRCLAGFEKPDSGQLLFQNKSLIPVPAQDRPFHMVFQRFALFPHMRVRDNIEFSLKIKKVSADKRRKRSDELLEMMQLQDFADRKPDQLSGGQAQRVALARALADEPQILLLDEPFSALDEKIRVQLRSELKSLQKKLGITFLFVTHDQQEALQMSDRIALFHQGRIVQLGPPEELFYKPQNQFAAEFIGQKNKIHEDAQNAHFILPEKIQLGEKAQIVKAGTLQLISLVGPFYELRIQDESGLFWKLYSSTAERNSFQVGQKLKFCFDPQDVMVVSR
jgi:ABC-type Fe3+/spermidine/putrescine transport system ATPase subunit